jgi:predicted RNA-binding protein
MSVVKAENEKEELVMESVTRLEVRDNGVEVSTFFEEPLFVPDVQVQSIDFLGGKVFLGRAQPITR